MPKVLVQGHTWSKGAPEHALLVHHVYFISEASGHRQSLASEASLNSWGNRFEMVSPKMPLKVIFYCQNQRKIKVFHRKLKEDLEEYPGEESQ